LFPITFRPRFLLFPVPQSPHVPPSPRFL
jgi:hypothetical protein